MKSRERCKAFSMAELIALIVIVGVMITFAIPTFRKAMVYSHEKTGAKNLKIIAEGMDLYYSRNRTYPTAALNNLDDINQALGIHVIDTQLTYLCFNGSQTTYSCHTIGGGYSWGLEISEDTTDAVDPFVYCYTGTPCPRCLDDAGGGCPFD